MATLAVISPGQNLTVRTYKSISGDIGRLWANTYELHCPNGVPDANVALNAVAAAFIGWEARFHAVEVRFDRTVISTYVEDGQPYDPGTFKTIDAGGVSGEREHTGSELMPLAVCLHARRQVNFGRPGRLLYRGVLAENEVTSPAGTPLLTTSARTALESLMEVGSDFDITAALDTAGFVMALVSGANGENVRAVVDILPVGVSIKKVNNRYYDRA